MIFEKYLIPDMMLKSFRELTPELLSEQGIKLIISDIDNTLVTYDDPEPTWDVSEWYKGLARLGIRVAFISNNHRERVEKFNSSLGAVALYDAHKPSPEKVYEILKTCGADRGSAVFLGDQLLTDCACAKRAGLRCFIVPPIKDKTTLFFKSKRLLEKPYIKKYRKLNDIGRIK